jgi:hypothetical protein
MQAVHDTEAAVTGIDAIRQLVNERARRERSC